MTQIHTERIQCEDKGRTKSSTSQNDDEEKFQDLPSGLTAGTCFGNVIFFVFIAMYLYVFLFWNIFIIFSPYFINLNGNGSSGLLRVIQYRQSN